MEKLKWVYKTVKYLQSYEYEDFPQLLQNAINTFHDDMDTTEWGHYFRQNYGNNYKLWAECYRKGCRINTNMHLEAMHRVIKYCYLEGKNVLRLDKGLHAVLKFVRDKIVDRMMKNTKGKNNNHISNIHKRHRCAVTEDHSVDIVNNVYRHGELLIFMKLLDYQTNRVVLCNVNSVTSVFIHFHALVQILT